MARKSVRDRFIEEYLLDRDGIAAALRAGVAKAQARRQVKRWLIDPEVIAEIDAATAMLNPDTMVSPQWVIANFQTIASSPFSSDTAKISALRELAKISKMYPEDKRKSEDDEPRKTNVLLMPADVPAEEWERQAMESQSRLKREVRE